MFTDAVLEVESLMDREWSNVTAVAEALLQRGTLHTAEIIRLEKGPMGLPEAPATRIVDD
jgi:hypothetical protein